MRNVLAFLLASTALPAFAAEPQKCATDTRLECITYQPNEVVHLKMVPGSSFRIQFADGERIVKGGFVVSDQRTFDAANPEPGVGGRRKRVVGAAMGGNTACTGAGELPTAAKFWRSNSGHVRHEPLPWVPA